MEVRSASTADGPAIRDVARRSLAASTSLSASAIAAAIEQWHSDDRLADAVADDDSTVIVATVDGRVVGCAESVGSDRAGIVRWLHVDPSHRCAGIGTRLFETATDELPAHDIDRISARVLCDNADGAAFVRSKGLTTAGEATIRLAERTYEIQRYASEMGTRTVESDDGTVHVDSDGVERGTNGAFYEVSFDESGEQPVGYYCENCGTLANAMDTMGRIECEACGNASKPDRWDSAYL